MAVSKHFFTGKEREKLLNNFCSEKLRGQWVYTEKVEVIVESYSSVRILEAIFVLVFGGIHVINYSENFLFKPIIHVHISFVVSFLPFFYFLSWITILLFPISVACTYNVIYHQLLIFDK